jgi:hypothetical protein
LWCFWYAHALAFLRPTARGRSMVQVTHLLPPLMEPTENNQ